MFLEFWQRLHASLNFVRFLKLEINSTLNEGESFTYELFPKGISMELMGLKIAGSRTVT